MKNLLEFVWHQFLGVSLFVVFAAAMVGLYDLVHWIESKHLNTIMTYVVKTFEYSLLSVDCILFFVFIIKSFKKTLYKLWNN